ncbi:MAG: PAS domain S-box protein, partial [Acidobacteria bacterium]
MRRNVLAAASFLLLALSLAGIGRALYYSSAWRSGLAAAALLVFAVVVLAALLARQRERLADAQKALARSEIRAQALIEASPDGVVLLSGTRMVFANPSFRRLLALPPDEEIAGRDLLALVAPPDRERVAAWLEKRQLGGQVGDEIQFTGRRVSGAEIPLEAASALLPARSGRQLALFVRDLSARKALETRLAHLARLEGLADIAERLVRDFDGLFQQIRRLARSAGKPGEARG